MVGKCSAIGCGCAAPDDAQTGAAGAYSPFLQALRGRPAITSIRLESPASVRFFSQTSPMGMGEASASGRKTTGAFSSSGQE